MNHTSPHQKTPFQSFVKHRNALNHTEFSDFLSTPAASAIMDAGGEKRRNRLYTTSTTLWAFISQVLNADRSCQAIVNRIGIQRIAEKKAKICVKTGAYCAARQRLPTTTVADLMRHLGDELTTMGAGRGLWRGRSIKLIDGTTLSMPDTPENQNLFPQSASQQPGLGFPLARLVGITDLATGAIIDIAIGAFKGKRASEHELLREMLHNFGPADVVIGDRYYCSYWLVVALQKRGAHIIVQQHAQRKTDFRKGKKLGAKDHLIEWKRPKKPSWMSDEDYQEVPEAVAIRELKVNGKVIVTTLLCPVSAPLEELGLYHQKRWNIELSLRDLKTTLKMDVLRCKTPEMITKEIHVYMLAYNLVRLSMLKAAQHLNRSSAQLSFKHCLQCWQEVQRWPVFSPEAWHALMELFGQIVVGNRPGRVEPRAVKRRPKPYPLLTKPRNKAQEDIRRFGHSKKQK